MVTDPLRGVVPQEDETSAHERQRDHRDPQGRVELRPAYGQSRLRRGHLGA